MYVCMYIYIYVGDMYWENEAENGHYYIIIGYLLELRIGRMEKKMETTIVSQGI